MSKQFSEEMEDKCCCNHEEGACDCEIGDCDCGCKEGKPCTCENCNCQGHDENEKDECNCQKEGCHCGNEDCKCDGERPCDEECSCHGECDCEECTCEEEGKECTCDGQEHDKSIEYLNLARQIQADFENFRRHAIEDIKQARLNGQASVIEVFLPCLDTFKEAKKSITDENVLKGVEMIEENINNALKSIGVEKINSIGEKYNPHMHNVIAVMRDESKDNDIILDEYQAGYKLNDKVIRYAKVIVNKKEG